MQSCTGRHGGAVVSTVASQQEGSGSVEFACSREFSQVCVVASLCQSGDELAAYQVCSMHSPCVCWDRLQHEPRPYIFSRGEWMDIMNHVTSDGIMIATLHGLTVPVIVGEVGRERMNLSPPLSCGSQWEPERRYAFWARRLYIKRQFCTDYTDASYLYGTLSQRTSAPGKMILNGLVQWLVPNAMWCKYHNYCSKMLRYCVMQHFCYRPYRHEHAEMVNCYTLFWMCSHTCCSHLHARFFSICVNWSLWVCLWFWILNCAALWDICVFLGGNDTTPKVNFMVKLKSSTAVVVQ